MSNQKLDEQTSTAADRDDAHLDDIEDGCGCAEVWEHMSEQRTRDSGSESPP